METILSFEQQSASVFSPGPVENEEILWRQMLNPTHYDPEKRELKATAFSDVASIGGSINRGFVDKEELTESALRRVADKNARGAVPEVKLHELVQLNCADVRNIHTPFTTSGAQARGFIVVDTALEDDRSHADICQIVSGASAGRSVRSALLDLANRYLNRAMVV